jgi:hypothetical protein
MQVRTLSAVTTAGALAALLAATAASAQGKPDPKQVERGRYLSVVGGCNDCHTPLRMGPDGPAPDMGRMLSGHPGEPATPPAPRMPEGPWAIAMAATATAFAGPWGTTFAANLTPDAETGIGKWTEADFLATIRSGRHMGRGRPILPPMPIQNMQQMTEEDLKALWAYLRTVPPVKNRVPELRPPAGAPPAAGAR